MNLTFSNLVPSPLLETDYQNSEVWGRDFNISGNEKVLISAASGKGKTTLLNMAIGRRSDYIGTVLIDGRSPLDMNSKERCILLSRRISVVHQGLLLFDELSLMQNIHLKNRITKFKTEAQINAMVNSLSLNNQRNQKVKTLSYGQKQRLAIIRALCQPFDFILLDEPFSHLDNDNAQTAWQLISNEAHEQKAGVILTSLGNTHSIRFDKIYQL